MNSRNVHIAGLIMKLAHNTAMLTHSDAPVDIYGNPASSWSWKFGSSPFISRGYTANPVDLIGILNDRFGRNNLHADADGHPTLTRSFPGTDVQHTVTGIRAVSVWMDIDEYLAKVILCAKRDGEINPVYGCEDGMVTEMQIFEAICELEKIGEESFTQKYSL